MIRKQPCLLVIALVFATMIAYAQTAPTAPKTTRTRPMPKKDVDPAIAAAVKSVSPAQIKATIEKLVSFHNRNTLTANDPELLAQGRGIVAARD